jgi:hypothetical protein
LLAETIAPTDPIAAENFAQRVIAPLDEYKQRPLIKLLGCRLQLQAEAKRVKLREETVEKIGKVTGSCSEPNP